MRCRPTAASPSPIRWSGNLDLHQENFTVPDDAGVELVILSAAPSSAAHDGLRLLAGLGATDDREREFGPVHPA
ncbi:hypothetical protein ABIA39_002465 [Nocardia sp. GAS34]|uniref:hypothetical protein n=1 Tax=unclassified Nocardia TaxID=2637762 RepID=UPI003D21B3B7